MGNSINIKVDKYQVLDSGTVLSHENSEILFEIKNLNIKICFRQDEQNKEKTVKTKVAADNCCLQLTLTNFENPPLSREILYKGSDVVSEPVSKEYREIEQVVVSLDIAERETNA